MQLKNLYFILAVFLFASCVPKKKLAEICADKYPVQERVNVKVSFESDTLEEITRPVLFMDSIICEPSTTPVVRYVEKRVEVPTIKRITNTIRKDSTIYIENTARVADLQIKLDRMHDKYVRENEKQKASKKRSKKRGWIILALSLIVLIDLGLKMSKAFSKFKF